MEALNQFTHVSEPVIQKDGYQFKINLNLVEPEKSMKGAAATGDGLV